MVQKKDPWYNKVLLTKKIVLADFPQKDRETKKNTQKTHTHTHKHTVITTTTSNNLSAPNPTLFYSDNANYHYRQLYDSSVQ